MRKRILRVALIASTLAVLVTGIPAGIAIGRIISSGERTELQGLALRAAVRVGPAYQHGDPIELPPVENGLQLGVYTPSGTLRSGTGPVRLESTLTPRSRTPVSTTIGGQLVEMVPVTQGEHVIGSVRAASPGSAVRTRTVEWWLAIAASALVALLCAGAYAARESRRLARPIDALTDGVTALGAGDFAVDPPTSGVAEIDNASDSLRRTAHRLADLVDRERSFTARASHQLHTPLTRMRLTLESGLAGTQEQLRSASQQALSTADTLSETIDDVLALAREDSADVRTAPEQVVEDVAAQWREPLASAGRRLALRTETTADVAVAPGALRQALGALVDNAVKHGRGTVSIVVRDSFSAVAIDVVDEGTGPAVDVLGNASLGLSLALAVVERAGGRLLVDRGDNTRFTLLLPTVDD